MDVEDRAASAEDRVLLDKGPAPARRLLSTRACLLVACLTASACLVSSLYLGATPGAPAAGTGARVPANATLVGLAAESYCNFDASKVEAYCKENTLDKTLVAPGDCSTWRYSKGALDSDRRALETCHRLGKAGCHVEDRRGDVCFSFGVPDWAQIHFQNYCAAKTPKNFFMRSDATRVYWLHENQVSEEKCPGCYLYDHNGGRCPCTGPGDMRCKMQACMQYEPYWCWATSVSMVAGYYFPDRYPNTKGDGPNCRGLECKIVGEFHYKSTPNICCENKDHCMNSHAQSGADIVNALNKYTGMAWTRVNVPVDPLMLKRVLMDGHPVVWDVKLPPPEGGGHAMVIGGTDGMGNFYVHDSMNAEGKGSFQILPWAGVLSYRTPWMQNRISELWGVYVPIHYVQQAR